MQTAQNKVVFVSMSDVASGAESVLLMAALASKAPILFLKKVADRGLKIPAGHDIKYVTDKSMFAGFLGLINLLKPYRSGYVIFSTHPYLNAWLGFLKRIGYLESKLIARECTSVFTRYNGLKKWSYQLAYRLGYPAINLVVCQTKLMRDDFLKNVTFVKAQKVIIQENPIDQAQIKLSAGLPLNDPDAGIDFICAAGRLIPEKGFSVLIRAFLYIKKKHPDLKLLIFGEGPQKIMLEKLITAYRLESRVILKGWTDNPMPYFKHAKICVVSSLKEGFPNVLLQMMILNPAVVSTLCAGEIENIPGITKAEVNNAIDLAFAISSTMNKRVSASKKLVQQFLHNRNPGFFIDSILNALQ
ncbi:glycosyltransferase [Mucilaginibacter sp.]|uniref:glycosyltransferase n=1 Tax=Mucilaginibacter sp. TaxID=1882438 RepID=UPI002627A99D|nr:glycosyltransferase [Mucilaginibacter sp.]MDB4923343.1 hypothetical protein [Mucilaginibacter sp.]